MQLIRIIGSTTTGWHRVDELTADALERFASVPDVFLIKVDAANANHAPGTCFAYAICGACPFTYVDAHKVLEMIRPMLLEVEANGQANRF